MRIREGLHGALGQSPGQLPEAAVIPGKHNHLWDIQSLIQAGPSWELGAPSPKEQAMGFWEWE